MVDAVAPVIVHVAASNGLYGGERVVANICRLLQNETIFVLCMTGDERAIAPFREEVEKSGSGRFICQNKSLARALLGLVRISRTHRQMVVHAHGYKEIFVACLFRLLGPVRIIVTQHGFTERSRKGRLYNFINKFCCRFGDVHRVICVSREIYKTYRAFGVSADRLLYLPNGLYLRENNSREHRIAARRRLTDSLAVAADRPVVLFAGRLSSEKDPLLFLSVIVELRRVLPEVCGLIAGDGPLRDEVEKAVLEMALGENVRLLGFVTGLDELLAGVDLLLLTSKTEGLPMVVLEAMSTGTPVVSADVGDVHEVVRHGKNGFLVDSRTPGEFARHCTTVLEEGFSREAFDHCLETVRDSFAMQRQLDVYRQLYTM